MGGSVTFYAASWVVCFICWFICKTHGRLNYIFGDKIACSSRAAFGLKRVFSLTGFFAASFPPLHLAGRGRDLKNLALHSYGGV